LEMFLKRNVTVVYAHTYGREIVATLVKNQHSRHLQGLFIELSINY
jgi:hypothetical protein